MCNISYKQNYCQLCILCTDLGGMITLLQVLRVMNIVDLGSEKHPQDVHLPMTVDSGMHCNIMAKKYLTNDTA